MHTRSGFPLLIGLLWALTPLTSLAQPSSQPGSQPGSQPTPRAAPPALTGVDLPALLAAAPGGSLLAEIRHRGQLRVGATGDYPPFTRRHPSGRYDGVDDAMAEHLAAALGVKLVRVPTTWAGLMDDLTQGRFDVAMGGISETPARARKGVFTPIYEPAGKVPVIRCADAERLKAPLDQPGRVALSIAGGTNEAWARSQLSQARVKIHKDNLTLFDALERGEADFLVTDRPEALYQAARRPALCALHPETPLTEAGLAYLMPKDAALNRAITAWHNAPETRALYQQLRRRWLTPASGVVRQGATQPPASMPHQPEPKEALKQVALIHGRAGPFAVAGYRMGQHALGLLGAGRGSMALTVVHHTPPRVEFSCVADGVQASTGASAGRLQLTLAHAAHEGATRTVIRKGATQVVYRLSPDFVERFRSHDEATLGDAGRAVMHLPDRDIFTWSITPVGKQH